MPLSPTTDSLTPPARVVAQHRGGYTVRDASGDRLATLAGALRRTTSDPPAVGDLVELRDDAIVAILPRRGVIARSVEGGVQTLAANVDMAWIITALGADVSARRVERYLALAAAGGVDPVVVVTKADLDPDPPLEPALAELRAVAGGAPVVPISSKTGVGTDTLTAMLAPDRTAVLLGSSGAGKSTLLNHLLGDERQATGAVREFDERGRHTTTRRELIELPSGGALIDTPGLRAVGVTDVPADGGGPFADIAALAGACRFGDCTHTGEPGCAVVAAADAGDIDQARLTAYLELVEEGQRERDKTDARARSEKERADRPGARALRRLHRDRNRDP
jgi:ribosome biogenesis GTPase